jgi:hypothetical protein
MDHRVKPGGDEGKVVTNGKETRMPSWRKKPANQHHLNKRYTPHQQQARYNAARTATQRLYCDVLDAWKGCRNKRCKRQRCCMGGAATCLKRALADIPQHRLDALRDEVIAGGPRRVPPATHKEWGLLRRYPISSLT